MEEVHARAVLGVSANASLREIEAAYTHRVNELRKQFEEAKDHRTREKCRRERDVIDEARRFLLDLEEEDQRQRGEDERLAAEQRQREEQGRLAAEQRQREQEERLAAEQRQREEDERRALEQRQREEAERLLAQERQREQAERRALEQRQREEAERLAAEERPRKQAERHALEQRQREEAERLAAQERQREEVERSALERRQGEERERLAAEQRRREEQERLAAEQRQREESERLAAEQRRGEQLARLAAEQREREEQEGLAAVKRQREEKKRRTAIWVGIATALLVILVGVFAAFFYWVDWQHKGKPGKLVLNTLPAKAEVFVDGVSRGKTPLIVDGLAPGERHLQIELKGYQDEQLVVLIEAGRERSFPLVTLISKKEPAPTVTPALTSATVSPTATSPTETPAATSPGVTPTTTPAVSGLPGERFPQTRLRLLTEADIGDLDYADLQYAINEMYARHGAQFLKDPEIRKQFEGFVWYVPMPGMTLSRIDREFTRIESQNRDLLHRLHDQKRPK